MANIYDDLDELTKDLVGNSNTKEFKKVNFVNKTKEIRDSNNSNLIMEEISNKEKSSLKIKELFLKEKKEDKKEIKGIELHNLGDNEHIELQLKDTLANKSFQKDKSQKSSFDNLNQEIEIKTMSKPAQIQKPNSDTSPINFLFNSQRDIERPKSGMKDQDALEFKNDIIKQERPNTSHTDQGLLFQKIKKEEKKSDKMNLDNMKMSENSSEIGKGIPIVDIGHSRLPKRRLKDNRSSISGQSDRPISANPEARNEIKGEIKRTGFVTGNDFFKPNEQYEQIGNLHSQGAIKSESINFSNKLEKGKLDEKSPIFLPKSNELKNQMISNIGEPEKSSKLEPFSFYQNQNQYNKEKTKEEEYNSNLRNDNNRFIPPIHENKGFQKPEISFNKKNSNFKNRPATPEIQILDMTDGSKFGGIVEDSIKGMKNDLLQDKKQLEDESLEYLKEYLESLKLEKQQSQNALEVKKKKLKEIEIEKASYEENISKILHQKQEILRQNENYKISIQNEMTKKLNQEKKELEEKYREKLKNEESKFEKLNEIKIKERKDNIDYYIKEYEIHKKLNDLKESQNNELNLLAENKEKEIKQIKMKGEKEKEMLEQEKQLLNELSKEVIKLEEEKMLLNSNLKQIKEEVTKIDNEINYQIQANFSLYTQNKNELLLQQQNLKKEEEMLRIKLYEDQFQVDKDRDEIRLRKKNIEETERNLDNEIERQKKFIEAKRMNLIKLEEDAIERKVRESKEIDQKISYIQQQEFDLSQRDIQIEQRKKDILNKEEDLKIKIAQFNLERKQLEVNRNRVQQTALKVMEESEKVKNAKQEFEEIKQKLYLKTKELESQKIAINAKKSVLEREKLDVDSKAKQIETIKFVNKAPFFLNNSSMNENQFNNLMKEKLIPKSSFKDTFINNNFNANEYLNQVNQELGLNLNQSKVMDYIQKEKEFLFENKKSLDINKFEMSKQKFSEDNNHGPTSSMRKGYSNSKRMEINSINSPSIQSKLKDNAYLNDSEL